MKKKIVLLGLIAIFLVVTLSVAQQKDDAAVKTKDTPAQNKGAKDVVIPNAKADVKLPHYGHQEALKDCNVCHDIFPQKSGSIVELKAQGKLANKQVMNTKCVKCHKEKKDAGQKSGPISCGECHKK